MKCLPTCMGKRQTFYFMMVLTTSMFLVEIIVGYMTKSMALVADSFHMLSDIISLFVGFFSLKFSRKKKDQFRGNTFGWARAEVLGALINGIFLLALCFSITIEGLKRLVEPEKLEKPIFILIVGTAGLVVNLVGMCLFHGHAGHGHSHGESSHGHGHAGSSHSHNKVNKKKNQKIKKTEEESKLDVLKPPIINYNNDALEVTIEPWNEGNTKPMKHDVIGTNCNGKNLEKNGSFDSVDLVSNKLVKNGDFKNEKDNAHGKPTNSSGQMNMKGVYLHLLGDALGSVVVIVAALVVYFFEGKQWTLYIDPVMSILMVVIIVQTLIPLGVEREKYRCTFKVPIKEWDAFVGQKKRTNQLGLLDRAYTSTLKKTETRKKQFVTRKKQLNTHTNVEKDMDSITNDNLYESENNIILDESNKKIYSKSVSLQ